MSRTTAAAGQEPGTIPELIERCFERWRRDAHYLTKRDGAFRPISTRGARETVRRLVGAFARAGIQPGDRVAIISPTRFEWALCDYALLSLGAVVVPIYPTLTAVQTRYILNDSGACMVLVANAEQWRKVEAVRAELPRLGRVISFDPVDAPGAPPDLERFLDSTGPFTERAPKPDDLASILYTSGTTGDPKGVMLTHRNIVSNVVSCTAVCPFRSDDLHLTFLPLSHIFERMVHYYMLWNGVTIAFAEDISKIKENLVEVKPTILTTVPRVLEKILTTVEDKSRAPGLAGRVAGFAMTAARDWSRARFGETGQASPYQELRRRLADLVALGKVRALLGGRVRVIVTGGAATPTPVTEFFRGLGIDLIPGYGLTESSPVIAFNTPRHFRFGSVGKPIPGVDVRIAADGEILARGASVMKGYYGNEVATRDTIRDGWLHTGDIGRLDEDGYLFITDRKKDILVTAGGKNVAPQPIEQRLGADEYIAQAVLVGDGRPYVAALIVPRAGALLRWAKDRGLSSTDLPELLRQKEVMALYRDRIAACCADRAGFEQVKRFALLEEELSEARGELTPTLKVKRRVVATRFAAVIEGLYD